MKERAWACIDRNALWHNVLEIKKLLKEDCRIMAVVKANAYGHGSVPVASFLEKKGIKDFAVASFEEGKELRRHGISGNILILGYTHPSLAEELREYHLTQTVLDRTYGESLQKQKTPLQVHLKIDTGMHRLGFSWEEKEGLLPLFHSPYLQVKGIFSHLCTAGGKKEEEKEFAGMQLRRFGEVLEYLKKEGLSFGDSHILASAGILNWPEHCLSMVRPGIVLYGAKESPDVCLERQIPKKPALSLKARIALVRTIKDGEGAGYSLAWKAKGKRKIAVAAIGYGDGLPGSFRGGKVLLRGKYAPVVGKICMDQMLLDVTEIPYVRPGDVITIIGKDGKEEIRAEEAARWAGMIANEFLSGLGNRIQRIYL